LNEAEYRTLDTNILTEVNKVRADPKSYVDKLKAMLPYFTEKVYNERGKVPVTTIDGKEAVEEAIKYLEAATGGDDKPIVPPPKLRRLGVDPIEDKDDHKVAPIIGTGSLKIQRQLETIC